MKIIFIRHGEPDNPNQTLTKKGFEEVKALADYYKDVKFDYVYFSPLARAKITAQAILSVKNQTGIEMDWLEEFHHHVRNARYAETCRGMLRKSRRHTDRDR
jgi:probable phosphoglycerate mutase